MNQAKPFLKALKMDLSTELNERASNISAGEEQVINFARAVVSKPKLLILDEATAKIDLSTEAFIQNELEKYRQGKTLLVIAHRLETIKNADKVISIPRRTSTFTSELKYYSINSFQVLKTMALHS